MICKKCPAQCLTSKHSIRGGDNNAYMVLISKDEALVSAFSIYSLTHLILTTTVKYCYRLHFRNKEIEAQRN